MTYEVEIKRSAQKALSRIALDYRRKISQAIDELANNPRSHQTKKLKGNDFWSLRIGSYRVIYEIKDSKLVILIVKIGHRREIYER